MRVKYLISTKPTLANIMQTERNRLQKETGEGFDRYSLLKLGLENADDKSHPAQMTGAKSAIPFYREQKLGSVQSRIAGGSCEIGRCALARSLTRVHHAFCGPVEVS